MSDPLLTTIDENLKRLSKGHYIILVGYVVEEYQSLVPPLQVTAQNQENSPELLNRLERGKEGLWKWRAALFTHLAGAGQCTEKTVVFMRQLN